MIKTCQQGIVLGPYLDALLHRALPEEGERRGILFACDDEPWSGNIVICGQAGAGKSTLALQIAMACTHSGFAAGYVSLEEGAEGVMRKAKGFGWERRLREARHLHRVEDTASPESLAYLLGDILTKPSTEDSKGVCLVEAACLGNPDATEGSAPLCDKHKAQSPARNPCLESGNNINWDPCVWLFGLSPTSLTTGCQPGALFQERYSQLERLLAAAHALNRDAGTLRFRSKGDAGKPVLPLICVDSLNVFGSEEPVREEYHRLFDLFHRHGIVGVFTVESGRETPFDSTMADVVIRLTVDEDQGYTVKYLEVEKSRYFAQSPGRHTFKILSPEKKHASAEEDRQLSRYGIVVFPSLHWHVAETARARKYREGQQEEKERFDLGETILNEKILQENVTRGEVVMIKGERGTFKTAIAQNFLAKGLNGGESVLLISLANRPQLLMGENREPRACMIAKSLASGDGKKGPFRWEKLEMLPKGDLLALSLLTRVTKGDIWAWDYTDAYKAPCPRLVEINFRSGMLLPEEFVQIVRSVLDWYKDEKQRTRFKRVVLDDVSLIGLSYPFLRTSSTTGDLFLSIFADLMRNYGVDLVMTGTTGDLPEANAAVNRAAALADAVVSCQYLNVFGDRYVTVRGQGLMRSKEDKGIGHAESVPAVVHWWPTKSGEKGDTFTLDLTLLEGLVGFESGEVRRPGLLVYLFSQYKEDRLRLYADGPRWENQAKEERLRPAGAGNKADSVDSSSSRTATATTRQRLGTHERYNASLQTLIESAFGRPESSGLSGAGGPRFASEVSIVRFDSTESEAVHDSLRLLGGGRAADSAAQPAGNTARPVDNTVIYSVDEFWDTEGFSHILTTGKPDNAESRVCPVDTSTDERKEHIVLWSRTDCVQPYFANVLLLAYRRAVSGPSQSHTVLHNSSSWQPESWTEVLSEAKGMAGTWPESAEDHASPDPCRGLGRVFWFDQSATETLACALMDALIAGYDAKDIRRLHKRYRDAGNQDASASERGALGEALYEAIAVKKLTGRQNVELTALVELLHMMDPADRWRRRLIPNACVYLCWYSQLRDLIDEYPQLAGQLSVAALPAGGFTGDWFVGIHRGSVSLGLGREVLRILCSRTEQYKRFAQGVGLPTLTEFYTGGKNDLGFFAWPGGSHVKAQRIREIHDAALSRSLVDGYQKFRSVLATVAFQLTSFSGRHLSDVLSGMKETVERIGDQAELLGKSDRSDLPLR